MEKSYVTQATHPQSDYMSVAAVATSLGLSKMTVYRMCWSGDLAYIRTGPGKRVYRILRSSFESHATPVRNTPVPIPGQLGINVCRSDVCGYCELPGHSSNACPDSVTP